MNIRVLGVLIQRCSRCLDPATHVIVVECEGQAYCPELSFSCQQHCQEIIDFTTSVLEETCSLSNVTGLRLDKLS